MGQGHCVVYLRKNKLKVMVQIPQRPTRKYFSPQAAGGETLQGKKPGSNQVMDMCRSVFMLTLVLLFFRSDLQAQERTYGLREDSKPVRIPLTGIIGRWYPLDSAATTIRFIQLNEHIVEIEGIEHGVGKYSFNVSRDSLAANGTAANWPPYYCTLRLPDPQHLEIEFYQFHSTESIKAVYKR